MISPALQRLMDAKGFWPTGWEPRPGFAQASHLVGIFDGDHIVITPTSPTRLARAVFQNIQKRLDELVPVIHPEHLEKARKADLTVRRVEKVFTDDDGNERPLKGFWLTLTDSHGNDVFPPTDKPWAIEVGIDRRYKGLEATGQLSDLIRDDREVTEMRTAATNRG